MAAEESKNQIQKEDQYDFLVYEYHTWGSYGQHIKTFKFLIDVEEKTQKPLWEVISEVKWSVDDSRKNKHRKAYVKFGDVLKMNGKIIKEVVDYQTASKRQITTKYYIISNDGLQEIKAETGVKINNKYYDILEINGKKILVNKDEVLVQ
jgi:hypothetical protein